jgi:hypothetical protein
MSPKEETMWSRVQMAALTALLAVSYLPINVEAEPGPSGPQSTVLFQNVRIFDGKSAVLSPPSNVLVRGNRIEKISTGPIPDDNAANVTTIEGRGRTLMPGLIDVHWHAMLARPNPVVALSSDIGYLNLLAGAEATATLLRGFTTIRDITRSVEELVRTRHRFRGICYPSVDGRAKIWREGFSAINPVFAKPRRRPVCAVEGQRTMPVIRIETATLEKAVRQLTGLQQAEEPSIRCQLLGMRKIFIALDCADDDI